LPVRCIIGAGVAAGMGDMVPMADICEVEETGAIGCQGTVISSGLIGCPGTITNAGAIGA
jgi:hypothetical protein